jgi:hypothetical protein
MGHKYQVSPHLLLDVALSPSQRIRSRFQVQSIAIGHRCEMALSSKADFRHLLVT